VTPRASYSIMMEPVLDVFISGIDGTKSCTSLLIPKRPDRCIEGWAESPTKGSILMCVDVRYR
jgi:hypothetical protein